jgi:hypothetical protein
MKKYRVKLIGIDWDDGKGEYDVSEAPADVEISVNALDPDDALEIAMDEVSETYGSLINGVTTYQIDPIG